MKSYQIIINFEITQDSFRLWMICCEIFNVVFLTVKWRLVDGRSKKIKNTDDSSPNAQKQY